MPDGGESCAFGISQQLSFYLRWSVVQFYDEAENRAEFPELVLLSGRLRDSSLRKALVLCLPCLLRFASEFLGKCVQDLYTLVGHSYEGDISLSEFCR